MSVKDGTAHVPAPRRLELGTVPAQAEPHGRAKPPGLSHASDASSDEPSDHDRCAGTVQAGAFLGCRLAGVRGSRLRRPGDSEAGLDRAHPETDTSVPIDAAGRPTLWF